MNETILILLIAVAAFAYAMVGHGGASAYLALMGIAGISATVMKPSALAINLCVSAIAFAQFARGRHFRWRSFWPFALLSIPCAFIGADVELDDLLYKRILAGCIVVAGLRLLGLFSRATAPVRDAPIGLALPIGAGIGLLSGVLGIGGGILLSPVLLLFAWADAKTAAATSALFIFVNSAASLLNLAGDGANFAPQLYLWTGMAIVAGMLGGWVGARKAPEPRLRQALGVVLLAASVKLMWP